MVASSSIILSADHPFHRIPDRLPAILNVEEQKALRRMLHDKLMYWNFVTTRKCIADYFFLAEYCACVSEYVGTCDRCKFIKPLSSYQTAQRVDVLRIFHIFSMVFAGSFPAAMYGNHFMVIAVAHLSC